MLLTRPPEAVHTLTAAELAAVARRLQRVLDAWEDLARRRGVSSGPDLAKERPAS